MHMNRTLLFLLLLMTGKVLQAQVTLALQVPPSGVVQKSQLWNMVLVNGGGTVSNVDVTVTLSNVADNNPVMVAASRTITLDKGAHQLKYTDFAPVNYKYLSSVFNGDLRPEGFIPIGNYTVCYTVGHWLNDSYEPLAEDCLNLEVQPLSPPVLNTPFDNDTIATVWPQFTWMPPSPLSLFTSLSYDIMVAEVLPNQSPVQAIQQNMPVYSAGSLTTVTAFYPSSARSLDTAKWYAWAVVARNNNQVVSQSEVWMFRVKGNGRDSLTVVRQNYITLQKSTQVTGVNHLTENNIGIRFYSYEKEHEATVRFIASDGTIVKELKQVVSYGDNFWRCELGNDFVKGTVYRIIVTDTQNNNYTASFSLN